MTKRTKAANWSGPAQLGQAGVGMTTAGITPKVVRERLALHDADALLTDARVRVRLTADLDEGTADLYPDAKLELTSVADVHRLSVGVEDIGFRLSFRRDDVDVKALCALAGKAVQAYVERLGNASTAKRDEDGGEG